MCAPLRIDRPTTSTSSWIGGGRDHLRRLVQAGVDDLHPGVAQRGGDDLGAAVVAVETGLGDENSDGTHLARFRWLEEHGFAIRTKYFFHGGANLE